MSVRLAILALSIPAALAVGCSADKGDDFGGSDTASSDGATAGGSLDDTGATDTGAPDEDTGPQLPPPAWFTMDADLNLTGGELTALTFHVLVWGEDTTAPLSCSSERSKLSFEPLELTPDPQILHWWSVTTEPESSDCLGAEALPEEFWFGLGEVHVDLLPALAGADLDEAEGIYGVYASIPTSGTTQPFCGGAASTACVYGYAATPQGFAGEAEPGDGVTVPDGNYDTVTVWFFPVE